MSKHKMAHRRLRWRCRCDLFAEDHDAVGRFLAPEPAWHLDLGRYPSWL